MSIAEIVEINKLKERLDKQQETIAALARRIEELENKRPILTVPQK